MWATITTTLTAGVSKAISYIGGYFEHKRTMRELGKKAEIKQAENLAKMDEYTVRQPKKWVRRIVVVCVMYPYVGSFIPYLQDNVLSGFDIMKQYPEWYILMLGATILSTIDYRTAFVNVVSAFKRKKK